MSAVCLSQNRDVTPSPEAVESLGGGWVGEEALSISLYCALVAGGDLARGVRLAVNHSGDSYTTGAITGNILGALLGEPTIPNVWLTQLELINSPPFPFNRSAIEDNMPPCGIVMPQYLRSYIFSVECCWI